jgi:signal transduction histidine kinase
LAKTVALMREHGPDLGSFLTNDPRGKQVPLYLEHLADQLLQERANLVAELEGLRSNVEHIRDIVNMQQTYAKLSGAAEAVRITELVQDAVRMNAGALTRHNVRLVGEFQSELPKITVERHKVLQILVNLIRNAKYACDESGAADKQIKVRVTHQQDRVRLSVIDNGVGIPLENLTRIFAHGFTTRKDGHGFALHSGALAAKEMGGSLTAQSDGPGTGAVFTLELPCRPPEHNS